MANDEHNLGVKLEASGAGIPLIQERVLKYLIFPVLRRMISLEKAVAIFEKEGMVALSLVREVPEDLRYRQVLVPRMVGIEDSSRNWSIMMTLDHLLIVSRGVAGLIAKLSRDELIEVVVDTADVKPDINSAANIERKFEVFLGRFRKHVSESVSNRKTSRCHVHPWFGCLNPHGWVVMLAVHQWIHRRQIQQICISLKAEKKAT